MLTIIFVRPGTGECLFLVIFVRGLIRPRIARLKGSVCDAVKRAICSVIVQMPQMPGVRWVVVRVLVLLIPLPLRHTRLLPPRSPPLLPQTSGTIVPSSEAVVVELCDEGFSPVSPSPQSQSILTGLVPPAPESSIGAFSSSASVLSDPDSIESFPTEIENNDNCMDIDTHDSCSILSNDGNDNGQSAHVHNDNDNGLSDKTNIKKVLII